MNAELNEWIMPKVCGRFIFDNIDSKPVEKAKNKILTLNFENTQSFHYSFFQSLHQFRKRLEKKDIALRSICLSKALERQLSDEGVLQMFNVEKDTEAPSAASPQRRLDVKFVSPFITATITTLQTQAGVPAQVGKPAVKSPHDPSVFDILGTIRLDGTSFSGSITLCFNEKTFLGICESLLGEKFTTITSDIEDAAGELLNIIYGIAKAELNDQAGYQIQRGLPQVIRGPQAKPPYPQGVIITLPVKTPHGDFPIEIQVD